MRKYPQSIKAPPTLKMIHPGGPRVIGFLLFQST